MIISDEQEGGTLLKTISMTCAAVAVASAVGSGWSTGAAAQDAAAIEAARAFIQPYVDHPTPFPVTEPLKTRPTGKKIAVIDCGSPICGLFADLAARPAELLGMKVTRFKSGTSPDGVAAAFDSILASDFDGVFVAALAPSLWDRDLDQLAAAHIAVAATGIIGLDPTKVQVAGAAEHSTTLSGQILANWTVANGKNGANTVFYTTPELSFSQLMADSFVGTMKQICSTCSVRVVDLPISSFGNRAPTIVVDDLLAHPETTTAVFAVGEQAIGLVPALKTASIKLTIALNSPDPTVLAALQNGDYDVGMGVDLSVLTWTLIDSLARSTIGQAPAQGAKADELVRQLLTAKNLKGNMSQGWTGYPDFEARFKALWADAK